ncbi:MAG TPA: TonB-dependent receptor, partial [Chitinophagaceae bacterium]|nr:TonB-dependent receptor [Chitinophagaceae bacterium]
MRIVLLMAVLCLGFVPAWSQTGSVKGFIFDKSNGEPLAGASIGFKQLKKGAQSDVNGFFNIPRIPAGTHTASISLIGYEASEIKVTVTEDEITSVKIQLNRKNRDLKGISISARREEKTYDTKVGMTRITPKEMKMMPAIGGEADIAQYLQVMPGVVSTGDQGGQLYIRGGSPIQNKILLDGMTIYNPFHSIGLYSVFETDGIRSADVMSGGFGVEYGDRTSAI